MSTNDLIDFYENRIKELENETSLLNDLYIDTLDIEKLNLDLTDYDKSGNIALSRWRSTIDKIKKSKNLSNMVD